MYNVYTCKCTFTVDYLNAIISIQWFKCKLHIFTVTSIWDINPLGQQFVSNFNFPTKNANFHFEVLFQILKLPFGTKFAFPAIIQLKFIFKFFIMGNNEPTQLKLTEKVNDSR